MTNAAAMQENFADATTLDTEYSELIQEVYLNPIRSVVVVDDEFPSLDALINKELGSTSGWKGTSTNAETVREILTFCRERTQPWLVDVHDGREVNVDGELNIARHLHQSDLMILDYHLLGDEGSGDKAIQILRNLAANHHFNMVVVYTKGYAGSDIQRVFNEIATALTYRDFRFSSEEEFNKIKNAMGEWEDITENIGVQLSSFISQATYLRERSTPGVTIGSTEGTRIIETLRSDDYGKDLNPKEVVAWLFDILHEKLASAMSRIDLGNLNSFFAEDINWIKTDSIFVTVVDKIYKPHELEGKLKAALRSCSPGPHQLLMAKMRAQIDEKGVIAEAAVLNDKYMQAGWLSELLDARCTDKKELIKGTVDRHWEALGDRLRLEIDGFATRLVGNIEKRGRESVMKQYAGKARTETEKILSHINLYNSTKPVNYSHLTTGHVLMLAKKTTPFSHEVWICLSPACDLVPGQKTSGWWGRLGEKIPFIAVHLAEIKTNTALDKMHENINVFLKINEEIRAFTFCPEGNPQSTPLWEQMFALNKGNFIGDGKTLKICRVSDRDGNLDSEIVEVTVVAQLRYEYALNLLQRLGGSLSRIGLDFRSRSLR